MLNFLVVSITTLNNCTLTLQMHIEMNLPIAFLLRQYGLPLFMISTKALQRSRKLYPCESKACFKQNIQSY